MATCSMLLRDMATFDVIPALDVLEGRCVRLSEGRRERVTIEGGEPAAQRGVRRKAHSCCISSTSTAPSRAGRRPGSSSRWPQPACRCRSAAGSGTRSAMQAALDGGAGRASSARPHDGVVAGPGPALRRAARRCRRREGRPRGRRGLGDRVPVTQRAYLHGACARAGVAQGIRYEHASRWVTRRAGRELLADVLEGRRPRACRRRDRNASRTWHTLRDLGCEGAVVGSALWYGRFTLAEALAV